jgi:DNA gyrase subunit A
VRRVDPGEEILMVSKEGLAVRFEEAGVRAMGRATGGVRGMNITGAGNEVLAMDVARDDQELLVVTENGFGKRTAVSDYRKTSRGAKGVQTIRFSEKRGGLAAALVVRPHQELVFISQEGMVQRTNVRGIRQTGRAAQGVTLMSLRDDDRVSAVALVVENGGTTAAAVSDAALASGPVELTAGAGESQGLAGSDGGVPGTVAGDGTGPEDIGVDDVETEDGLDGPDGAG